MSVKLLESFDFSTNISQIAAAQYRWNGSVNMTTTASGRTGRCVETVGTNAYIYIHLPSVMSWSGSASDGTDELYLGFAFRLPSISANIGLCGLWAGGLPQNAQNGIRVHSNGSVDHFRGTSTTINAVLGTSIPGVVTAATWHYLEWNIKRGTVNGRSTVKIDDVQVLDFAGDTHDSTNAVYLALAAASFSDSSFDSPTGTRIDDVYIVDPDGTGTWNGFMGNTFVPLLAPNANGSNSDWLGSDGNSTDNYQLVDETSSINDLDYVEASADGDIDTYEHATYVVPAGYGIASVQVTARAAYLAGAKKLKVAARLEDGTYESKDTTFDLTATMNPRWNNFEEKPGGGGWTQTDLDDAEFGVEQAAP